MWFGTSNAFLFSALSDPDSYHVFPNNEEGRRAIKRISETFYDSFIWLGDDGFYVALSHTSRSKLFEKIKEKWRRKNEKLQKLKLEVDELAQVVNMISE